MGKNQNSNRRIKTVKNASEILETVRISDGISLSELTVNHDLSKTTIYNHLKTLEELQYIHKKKDKYYIGLGFVKLGECALQSIDLPDFAEPEALDLAEEINGRVEVMVEQGGKGYCVYQYTANDGVTTNIDIGDEILFYCTAMGKAYLSALPQDEAETIVEGITLEPMTENTITSREELYNELEMSKKRGYSINDEERVFGMRAIGAPIVTQQDSILGSISVSLPVTRMDDDLVESRIPTLVRKTASVIAVKEMYD